MNEQDIPIDIHTSKLLDWLTSRRHCSKDWQKGILEIREKINNAIQDMPVHDGIVKLLTGTHINYFHCLKIIEILKETEADTKNLFGRYGSQRMRDWQEIIRLYERDSIYLAEAAQMLIRNINYEIPSLRKQISKLEQLRTECSKKEVDYIKAEKSLNNEFNSQCKQLGIAGKKIKHELVELLLELPELYQAAAESAKSLKPAIELHKAFLEFTMGTQYNEGHFPLLTHIIEHGNTTTYEWKYGEAPIKIEEPALSIKMDDESATNNPDTIDFGDAKGDTIDFGGVEDQIDFGDVQVEDNINWDIETVDTTNGNDVIDFNITLEESGIVVEDSGLQGGVACGDEALTILDNPSTRGKYVDELMELEAFLKMRLYELSTSSEMDALSQLQATGSAILQLQTIESVTGLLSSVQGALATMTNNRIQHLHSIKHSPKYIDYLAYSLKQKLAAAEKTKASQKVVTARRDEAAQQVLNLKPILAKVIEKTRELQGQIEQDISKRYKGREVNLIGGVRELILEA